MTWKDTLIMPFPLQSVPEMTWKDTLLMPFLLSWELKNLSMNKNTITMSHFSLLHLTRGRTSYFPQHQDAFIIPDGRSVKKWHRRYKALGAGSKNVGIAWRGGSHPRKKAKRSTNLKQWRTLLETPNINWINLQYGDCSRELKEIRDEYGIMIHNFHDIVDPLKDLDGHCAQIKALDLVISLTNSIMRQVLWNVRQ
jgi:hypothetical protein